MDSQIQLDNNTLINAQIKIAWGLIKYWSVNRIDFTNELYISGRNSAKPIIKQVLLHSPGVLFRLEQLPPLKTSRWPLAVNPEPDHPVPSSLDFALYLIVLGYAAYSLNYLPLEIEIPEEWTMLVIDNRELFKIYQIVSDLQKYHPSAISLKYPTLLSWWSQPQLLYNFFSSFYLEQGYHHPDLKRLDAFINHSVDLAIGMEVYG